MQQAPPDITRTRSLITDYDVYLFRQGSHSRLYDRLGSHPAVADGRRGTFFAVWAPNAAEVSVIGDFNGWEAGRNPLSARSDDSGIWEGFLPDIGQGALYKYHIRSRYNDYSVEKGDPFARFWEIPPKTASIVWDLAYTWRDRAWMRGREEENSPDAPISVYEMHAGSWRKVPEEGNRSLSYREAADELAEYLVDAGFTHVEFLPIMEHPFYASWGYQTLGYFAPTSRYGTPQDFMHLIDCLHQRGVGVILDWVPSHFPADGYGLSYFDGTYLYEHALPGQRYHPEWKSYVFNLARNEVRSFLLSSAIFWLERYHADGLRVDAVSSMLYLDYARSAGEWTPNVYGGRENLEAIGFLRKVNETVHANFPDVLVIAEEATSWPGVTAPTATGGLGFDLKWNMGWMHDTLDYFVLDPVFRKYRPDLFTFSIWYAFNERYVLPLSHDEVVHEKSSLIGKMPGDEWRKRANLRLLYGYMFTHPGKKLLFMGGEFGQWSEWSHDAGLEWHLLQYPSHQGILRWTGDLNRLYRRAPALHERDADPEGFEWVDFSDVEKSIVSYLRRGRSADDVVLVVCNCTPVPRYNYRVGVPFGGFWEEVLNSDAVDYGGSGVGNLGGVEAEQVPVHGRPWSLPLTLPPLGVVIFAPEGGVTMDRAICIHGHFYQPSRENPWLGDIEVQRSAAPYHDWNERVAAECYGPNTAARILDADGLIGEIVNTYSKVSFTAAPTLLSWLAQHRPAVYRAIIDADRESRERYAGHGSAIASCYSHLILPLATPEEKRTQVAWGVRDFASRFGREPEGMWLPETAVDLESLDLMAGAGIRFTILAPHQAGKVRAIGAEGWTDASGGRVETRMPYLCRLPSGRSIAIFFYDGAIARDVAFGDLLSDGRRFSGRLLGAFSPGRGRPELVHIATDGETYGHHREFGEMALAYCLRTIEARRDVRLTVYGEYLAAHPPTHEVAVREGTSWSCTHGVGRWREECGCHSGAHPGWSQAWRRLLREAVAMVRDALAPRSAEELAALVRNPREARDDAVGLVLNRWSDGAVEEFFSRHALHDLSPKERRRVLALLEMERQAMLMQTSCGWFFDDIAEPGSVQVMRHAGRAMDLARRVLGIDLEAAFIEILTRAPSNDPGCATGAAVYEAQVRPAAADLARVGAGAALYEIFGLVPLAAASGMYAIRGDWPYRSDTGGRQSLLGTVRVQSRVTGEEAFFDAVASFAGIDRVVIGVREPGGDEALRAAWEEVTGTGGAGAFARVYTASDLSDEERWTIARQVLPGIGSAVCAVYRDAAPLLGVLDDLGIPEPRAAIRLREHAGTGRLLAMLEAGCPDPDGFAAFAGKMRRENLRPDLAALGEAASRRIAAAARKAAARPGNPAPLEEIVRIVRCAKVFGLALTLWESQNACIGMRGQYAAMQQRAGRGDEDAERWAEAFRRAATCLGVRVT